MNIGKWRGEIFTQLGFALAMTQTHAIIWRYTSTSHSADHLKPLSIRLPNSSSNPRHPLPLGVLVPTSSEPSFLVLNPTNGKISYWETLSSAASVEPIRQKQQSVQGSVSGLMSGEIVNDITEAEPQGFLLTFSTGRLAHLTVSDAQGKPSISVQFLRDSGTQTAGIFGSLRNVFSSAGWRKDIAAIRAGHSIQRGQRYMVVATSKGGFQTWDFNWNGTHTLVSDVDTKHDILRALAEAAPSLDDQQEHQFEVLDVTIIPNEGSGREMAKANQSGDVKVMGLTVLKGTEASRYALVGLTLSTGCFTVDVVHPITCYDSPTPEGFEFRPQVMVPTPYTTAFVVFEKSLALVTLDEVDATPDSQLQMEAHALPDPFQDAIDFRRTKPYKVVGCAPERCDKSNGQPSCLAIIFGFDIIRICALPSEQGQSVSDKAAVTARSKIEQAVFFGTLPQDLLDFSPRSEVQFTREEIETAALDVSHSIMSSASPYIPTLGLSMEQQLKRRSAALDELNKHLRTYYPNELGRLTKWKLLWGAEKMASARAIWKCYNTAVSHPRKGPKDPNLLSELIEAMSEDLKIENRPEHHETDGVRHWFINDVWRLEWILPWAQNMVELLFTESVEDRKNYDQATQARLVGEANDIQLAGLETAFKFREANAGAYGLENEILLDGVLQHGYEELPEIWTSTANIVERVKLLIDVSRELTKLNEDAEGEDGEPTPDLVLKLAADNPRQVQICCQTYIERSRWLKSRSDQENKADGDLLMKTHFEIRRRHFVSLSDVGQPDMGMQLAEKYRDMQALVDIIDQELEAPDSEDLIPMYNERINSYFVKFGVAWANAFFKKHLNGGKAVIVLTGNGTYKKHLTNFLRSHPAYAKLGWLNEVLTERNYVAAADSLNVAQQQERNLWSQKIGLSMGKLNLLAAQSRKQTKPDSVVAAGRKIDESLAILSVQERLYDHIKPTLRDALDADAEGDLAMQKYGSHFVKDKPILRDAFQNSLRKLLAMETLSSEGLIDVLTLMDDEGIYPDDDGVIEMRFLSAFKVLRLCTIGISDPGRKDLLEGFIWRRCMIQDNWEVINRTELKAETQVENETGATSLFQTLKEGYRTGFFDRQSPLPPSSLTQVGSSVESLRASSYLSKKPEHALELLAQDLAMEGEFLEQHIEKGRLEEWWRGVLIAAKSAARAEADAEGEKRLQKRHAEEAFERRLAEMDSEAMDKGEDEGDVDEQGDVMME